MVQQQRVSLEEGLPRVEGSLAGVSTRLDAVERRLESLEARLDARMVSLETRMDGGLRELRQRQDRLFWMIFAILLPMWITIILAIVIRTPQ